MSGQPGVEPGFHPSRDCFGTAQLPTTIFGPRCAAYVSTHRCRVHSSSSSSCPAINVILPRWYRTSTSGGLRQSDSRLSCLFVCLVRMMWRRVLATKEQRKTRRSFFKANCVSRSQGRKQARAKEGVFGRSSKACARLNLPWLSLPRRGLGRSWVSAGTKGPLWSKV